MSKVTYAATLSDGTRLTRKTARHYSAAWALVRDGKVIASGFAARADLAQSAANSERNGFTGRWSYNAATSRKAKSLAAIKYYRELEASKGGRAAWNAEIVKAEAAIAVEIVPAKLVPEGF